MSAPLRVAIIADYLEEGWPSMDLVADMLMEHLASEHAGAVDATLVRPPMRRRASRLFAGARSFDRVLARFFDYPRALRRSAARFDVYHVVDHSYAHLVHALPAERTLVTCHDLDTFRSILEPRRRAALAAVPGDDAADPRRACAARRTSPATARRRAPRWCRWPAFPRRGCR